MSVEDPKTFDELMSYIERYMGSIFVRDFKNGEVGSYSLVELPVSRALKHVFRWLRKGVIPLRVISAQELFEKEAEEAYDMLEEAPPTENS